jgi:hypothetical protein
MKLLFSIAFTFILFSAFADDLTIYVSPSGKGKGSAQAPTSLQNAVAMLPDLKKRNPRGIITIVLNDGEYELNSPINISNENGGTKDLKIIFKAAANARPVISGGKKIILKGEKVLSANILSLLEDKKIEPYDIYVNHKRAVRARTPNSGLLKFRKEFEIKDSVKLGKDNSTQCYEIPTYLSQQLSSLSTSQLKKVRFNIYHKWDNTMRSIDSLDNSKSTFYSTGSAWKPWNMIDEKATFYVANYAKALDTCNEWYLDGNVVKYIPVSSNITKQEITVPFLEKLLIISGDSNKYISNITFQGVTFSYSNKQFKGFEPAQAAASIDAAIMIDFASNIKFDNCEISHTGQYAIWFRNNVRYCELKHCYINDLGAGGVRIGETALPVDKNNFTSYNTVEDCIIHSGGYNYPSAVGVFIAHSANNTISHNDIADFRYTGVSVGWIWGYAFSPTINNKIVYNHIHHLGWGVLSDMAAVYTLGISPGTEVSHNVINDVYSYDYGGWGLYTDEGSSYIRMESNLVYRTKTGGFHQHYGKENIIQNNIIAFNDKYQAQDSRIEAHKSFDFIHNIIISDRGTLLQGAWKNGNLKIDSNCYWSMNNKKCLFMLSTMSYGGAPVDSLSFTQWQKNSVRDQHSVFEDPGFVNASQYNFKFKANSVVKKIGFVPFDFNEAGVTGNEQWKKLAMLPKDIIDMFDVSVRKNMLP